MAACPNCSQSDQLKTPGNCAGRTTTGIALFLAAPGQRRICNDRGIDDGIGGEARALAGQVMIQCLRNPTAEFTLFSIRLARLSDQKIGFAGCGLLVDLPADRTEVGRHNCRRGPKRVNHKRRSHGHRSYTQSSDTRAGVSSAISKLIDARCAGHTGRRRPHRNRSR